MIYIFFVHLVRGPSVELCFLVESSRNSYAAKDGGWMMGTHMVLGRLMHIYGACVVGIRLVCRSRTDHLL